MSGLNRLPAKRPFDDTASLRSPSLSARGGKRGKKTRAGTVDLAQDSNLSDGDDLVANEKDRDEAQGDDEDAAKEEEEEQVEIAEDEFSAQVERYKQSKEDLRFV